MFLSTIIKTTLKTDIKKAILVVAFGDMSSIITY